MMLVVGLERIFFKGVSYKGGVCKFIPTTKNHKNKYV